MKVSASVELIWQLASQEAIAAEFKEIEPDHFFSGLMKFSELPVEEVDKIAPGSDAAKDLSAEVVAVREALDETGIDSRIARRKLREFLGRGGKPYDGDQLHRSAGARSAFDRAAQIAEETGSDMLAARHILAAILAAPSPAIDQVLGEGKRIAGRRVPKSPNTPLLNEFGQDLTRLAAEGKLSPAQSRQAECKAVLRTLERKDRRGVLLLSDNDGSTRSVIETVAQALSGGKQPAGLKGKRLIDVTAVVSQGGRADESAERLRGIVVEAAATKDVILVWPAIETQPGSADLGDVGELLKGGLMKGGLQCICRIEPAVYRRWVEKDTGWRKLVDVISISETPAGGIPNEL